MAFYQYATDNEQYDGDNNANNSSKRGHLPPVNRAVLPRFAGEVFLAHGGEPRPFHATALNVGTLDKVLSVEREPGSCVELTQSLKALFAEISQHSFLPFCQLDAIYAANIAKENVRHKYFGDFFNFVGN